MAVFFFFPSHLASDSEPEKEGISGLPLGGGKPESGVGGGPGFPPSFLCSFPPKNHLRAIIKPFGASVLPLKR